MIETSKTKSNGIFIKIISMRREHMAGKFPKLPKSLYT